MLIVTPIIGGVAAIACGFAAAAYLIWRRPSLLLATIQEPDEESEEDKAVNDVLRVSDGLVGITQQTTGDVLDHSSKVEFIAHTLQAANAPHCQITDTILVARDRLVAANSQLREQLARAEHRLAVQRLELRRKQILAHNDHLTGLLNRRAFDRAVEMHLDRLACENEPFCLLMIDIDHFKQLNDSFGHEAGDTVLKRLAQIFIEQTRDVDTICRFGGEEFAILLPGATSVGAAMVANRIRQAIENSTFSQGESVISVTASVGFVEVVEHQAVSTILHAADEALYNAKRAGRNSVCAYDRDTRFSKIGTPV